MIDDLDQKLITILRHDGRRSVSDLAAKLGVSRATIRARVDRLERSGEILGYTVILRADAADLPVRGITLVLIEGHAQSRVTDVLAGFADVTAIHSTNGKWDLLLEIATLDLPSLDDFLSRLRLIPGILGSETNLLLATKRSTRARLR